MPGNSDLREEYLAAAEAFREEATHCQNVEDRVLLEAQAAWWESRYVKLSSGSPGR